MKKKARKRLCWLLVTLVAIAAIFVSRPLWKTRNWIVEGIAATTTINRNDVSFNRDVLARGVNDLPGTAVVIDHESALIVGSVRNAWLVRDELHVCIKISKVVPHYWEYIKDGSLRGLSIAVGNWGVTNEVDPIRGAYDLIHKGEVTGVCLTTRPADPRARVTRWYEE